MTDFHKAVCETANFEMMAHDYLIRRHGPTVETLRIDEFFKYGDHYVAAYHLVLPATEHTRRFEQYRVAVFNPKTFTCSNDIVVQQERTS
jgi:hypothetical protein